MDSVLGQSALDALNLQLAALDKNGNITLVNRAWRIAVGEQSEGDQSGVGLPYRGICAAAYGPGSQDIDTAIEGILSVCTGTTGTYALEYSRELGGVQRNFRLQAKALDAPNTGAIVTHKEANSINTSNTAVDFEQVFENSANEFFLGTLETMKVDWINKRARVNLGYTLEEIRALPPLSFLSGVNVADMRSALHELTSGKQQTLDMLTSHIRKDGTQYPVHAQLQVIQLRGKPMLVAMTQDVSEVSSTRRELARARILLESAPDATVVVDEQGLILATNNQITSLLGYSRNELVGEPVETLIPKRFSKQHVGHRINFFAEPRVRGMGAGSNLYAQTKDGHELPIEVSLSPVESGGQTLVAAALRDISERLAIEQARRESETNYQALFESSSDLIQSFDNEGKIDFVNPAWLAAMEYDPSQIAALNFMDLVAPQCREYAQELTKRLRAGAKIHDIEITYLTRTGKELHLEGNAMWEVVDGKRVSSRAILHDVTERNRNEAELREAKEIAEQATAGKSRFLAAASHDLRQPLQALRLYLSVMERLAKEPKLLEVATKMGMSLETMGELLDALLDISRLDGGAVEPEIADLSIRDLLQGIFTTNLPHAEAKGLTLELTGSDYSVRSDPGLLARILDNFVSNAIRYTETGGITLNAELDGDIVVVSVQDSGVGIPTDQLDRVFEEYFQVENASRDRRKGLGLGLAIVKHIANLLGHSLNVSSLPGKGSTFAVSLPLVREASSPRLEEYPDSANGEFANNPQVRILFVEDDPAIVDATAMLLASANLRVQTVMNGRDAISAIDGGPRPDVLVTDYRLPGPNGVEVARHAQAVYGESLPVVLMTGDTTIKELETANISNYTLLRKPVDTDALINLIEQLSH